MTTNCFQVNRNAVSVVELNVNTFFFKLGKTKNPNNRPKICGFFYPRSLEIKSANNRDNCERNRALQNQSVRSRVILLKGGSSQCNSKGMVKRVGLLGSSKKSPYFVAQIKSYNCLPCPSLKQKWRDSSKHRSCLSN